MREVEIAIDWESAVERVDRAIKAAGLRSTLRGTLRAFAGSVHWHVKSGSETGTLEITVWPERKRAWFSVQDGRKGEWIEEGMRRILEALGARVHE
jgi:hypothetical protein